MMFVFYNDVQIYDITIKITMTEVSPFNKPWFLSYFF